MSTRPIRIHENIRSVIDQEWCEFRELVRANELGTVSVRQCEIAYINHIEKGHGWEDYGQLGNVLTVWSGASQGQTCRARECQRWHPVSDAE